MPKSLEPFESARLKIVRGRHHVAFLQSAIDDYMAQKPFAVVVEKPTWDALGSHVWTSRIRQPIPPLWAAVIGDAVHNFRAALDLMASDLVRLNGGSTNGVYFPFAHSAKELAAQIKSKHIDRAGQHIVRVVESLRPYKGGNYLLRALHDLDVQDKHQALLPAVGFVKTPPLILLLNGHPNPIPSWESAVVTDGQVLMIMPAVWNVPLGSEISAEFNIVFDDDSAVAGSKIIPTLEQLGELVDGIVDTFGNLCRGKAFPTHATPPKSTISKGFITSPPSL